MAEVLPDNGLQTTLETPLTAGATTLQIKPADATKWNHPGEFRAVVASDPVNGPWELVRVTAGQGTANLTVTRAVEAYNGDQTARAWPAGAAIAAVITKASLPLAVVPDPLVVNNATVNQVLTVGQRADIGVAAVAGLNTIVRAYAGGNGAGDTAGYHMYSKAGTLQAELWTDAANATTRLKSNGAIHLHAGAGGTGFTATNQRMSILTDGKIQIGTTGTPPPYITPRGEGSYSLESSQYALITSQVGSQLAGNMYWDGTDWLRYSTASGGSLVAAAAAGITFYRTVAGTGPAALLSSGGIGADGSWTVSGSLSVETTLSVGGILTASAGSSLTNRVVISGGDVNGIAIGTGSLGNIEVQGPSAGAAKIAFHRPGYYAAYFGLDTDNSLKIGGWSMGAVAYKLLDTRDQSVTWNADVGVTRYSGGSIQCGPIYMPTGAQGGVPAYIAGQTGDGWMRWWPKSVTDPATFHTYAHTLNVTTNQAWNTCTINGAVADAYLNNQSGYFAVKAGATYAIYGTVGGYYNVGLRIFTDYVQRAQAETTGHPDYIGGVGCGWVGVVNTLIQFQARAGVTFNSSITVTLVPTPAVPI